MKKFLKNYGIILLIACVLFSIGYSGYLLMFFLSKVIESMAVKWAIIVLIGLGIVAYMATSFQEEDDVD